MNGLLTIKEILFAIVVFVANTVQTITGFAGGPISMAPSMALVGVSQAKVSLTFMFLILTGAVAIQGFRDINPKKLGKMIVYMLVGLILGMWLFNVLPTTILMVSYGVIVVLIGLKKLVSKSEMKLKFPWNYGVLLLSGIMQGMFTSGGPFLVLYAAAEMKDKKEFRATVSAIWAILNLYMSINMFRQGLYTPEVWRLILISMVTVVLGIWVGNKVADRINQKTFLILVYVLLIVSGASLIFNAVAA